MPVTVIVVGPLLFDNREERFWKGSSVGAGAAASLSGREFTPRLEEFSTGSDKRRKIPVSVQQI
jgi:hypothetical protein